MLNTDRAGEGKQPLRIIVMATGASQCGPPRPVNGRPTAPFDVEQRQASREPPHVVAREKGSGDPTAQGSNFVFPALSRRMLFLHKTPGRAHHHTDLQTDKGDSPVSAQYASICFTALTKRATEQPTTRKALHPRSKLAPVPDRCGRGISSHSSCPVRCKRLFVFKGNDKFLLWPV